MYSGAQEIINLYPSSIPNETLKDNNQQHQDVTINGLIRKVAVPTLQMYLPKKEIYNGTAVIICPGGGYSVLVYEGEGISTAKKLVEKGITAFVLKYRLPDDSLMKNKSIAPLQDALQAIKIVRENADKWDLNPEKIGIMGFSAGGHLASTLATHFQKALIENENNTSLRPDFQVLIYPVISMQDTLTHKDSKRMLLGNSPSKNLVDEFSNELQVDENTPPAYITHAADDTVVDVDNSIVYFEKLRHFKIPVELHIYPKGNHGFIFKQPDWTDSLFNWMKNYKWIH